MAASKNMRIRREKQARIPPSERSEMNCALFYATYMPTISGRTDTNIVYIMMYAPELLNNALPSCPREFHSGRRRHF